MNKKGIDNPNYKHGGKGTRLYIIWQHIKDRCLNSKANNYKDYGGRGITICNEWLEFIPFRDWSLVNGYADNLTIDRIENNGNYEPNNCQWITHVKNNQNKRNTKLNKEIVNEIRIKYDIGNYTQNQLAKEYNLNQPTISLIITNKRWKN